MIDAPWLSGIWQQLSQGLLADRLPHGVLLGGAAGSGHDWLAEQLLEAALCQQPTSDGLACGECRGCHLRERGSHEDLHRVEPLEDRKSLSVEQIRELSEQLSYAPQRARHRVALIRPAEAMSVAACNALLKTLEEPPAAALLILVSNQPRALLPTLRSRCGQWLVRTPPPAQSLPWVRDKLGCSVAEANWRLALNSDAVLAALSEDSVSASLELVSALHALLSEPQTSAADLVRREKTRLALLIRVSRTVLSLSARPQPQTWPPAVAALLALTALLDSSSLQRLAREIWQVQRWSGSGVREDLQMLATLGSWRTAADQGRSNSTAQA